MPRIRLESSLYDRAKTVADAAGYSSVDEFVTHLLEKELEKIEDADSDETLVDRLKGLGYLE